MAPVRHLVKHRDPAAGSVHDALGTPPTPSRRRVSSPFLLLLCDEGSSSKISKDLEIISSYFSELITSPSRAILNILFSN